MNLQEQVWRLEQAFWQLKGAASVSRDPITREMANEIAAELNQPARLENWVDATVPKCALQSPPGK